MTGLGSFGHNRNYCAAHVPPGKEKLSPVERNVMALLNDYDQQLRERVERAFKQWNQIIREYLRSETALRLSVGDDLQTVPVRIMNGLPAPFEHFFGETDTGIWRLYLHRALLSQAVQGLKVVDSNFSDIVMSNLCNRYASPESIQETLDFLSHLSEQLDKQNLLTEMMAIPEDTLGAYFFRVPEIHLYWMVIGLLASALDVSVEGLTVVVLIHELTHAYTHLGKDIDGNRWDIEAFAHADLGIVEGLAQFYTSTICNGRLGQRFPDALKAYQKLVVKQSGPYIVHQGWVKENSKAGEIIRFSMINARMKSLKLYEDYCNEMQAITTLVETAY